MIIKEIMDKINGQDVTKIQQSLLIPQKAISRLLIIPQNIKDP